MKNFLGKYRERWIPWGLIVVIMAYYAALLPFAWPLRTADAAVYLDTAYNLVHGRGLAYLSDGRLQPYVFWPPLFPLLIAAVQALLHTDGITAAYIVSGSGLMITLWLLYRLSAMLLPDGRGAGAVLFLFAGSWVFDLFYGAASEAVFIPLFLASMYAMLRWYRSRRISWLCRAGVLTGFMVLTRYAGLGVWAGYASFLLSLRDSLKNKILHVLLLSLPAGMLFLPWYVHTSGSAAFFSRRFAVHPPGAEHVRQWAVTVVNWLAPGATRILFVPLVLFAAYGLVRFLKKRRPDWPRDFRLFLTVAAVYLLFIILSITFFDYDTPLDTRILAPVYLSLLPVTVYVWYEWLRAGDKLALTAGVLWLGSHAVYLAERPFVFQERAAFIEALKNDGVKKILRQYPGRTVYTNVPGYVRYAAPDDTLIRLLPPRYDRSSLRPDPDFAGKWGRVKKKISEGRAIVVWYPFVSRPFLPDTAALDSLPVVRRETDRAVIFLPQNILHE